MAPTNDYLSLIEETAIEEGPKPTMTKPSPASNGGGIRSANIKLSEHQSQWAVSCGGKWNAFRPGMVVPRTEFDRLIGYKKEYIKKHKEQPAPGTPLLVVDFRSCYISP